MIENVWQFQQMISRRLLRWGIFSVASGAVMFVLGGFWRQLGAQFASWGFINVLIAVFGQVNTRQRVDKLDNPGEYAIRQEENQKLRKILWVNVGLGFLYLIWGGSWMKRRSKGSGLGIIIQGGALLLMDLFHVLTMPDERD